MSMQLLFLRPYYLQSHWWAKELHARLFQFIVAVKKPARSVLIHPVMKKLIDEKWKWKHYRMYYTNKIWYLLLLILFRRSFWIYLILFIYFVVVWAVIIAYPSVQEKHVYNFPDDILRILFSVNYFLHIGSIHALIYRLELLFR